MFVRRNDSVKQLMGHQDYKYRAGFAVPLLNPNPDGLPTNEEMEVLNSIEEALSLELEKNQEALLVLVITTSGMREFVCYTKNPDVVNRAMNIVQSKFTSHKVQSYVENDPNWGLYKQF